MAETMTSTQQLTYTIAPTDRKGRPAPVENVEWASSNTEVATVTAAADGLSAVVAAVVPGSVTISVTADADMGEGVTSLAGTAELTVTPAAAVSIALVASAPEEQPE